MTSVFYIAWDSIKAIGPIATVVGLVLTVMAIRGSHKQSHRLATLNNDLGGVAQSLTTKYVGQFPDFNDEIASLIGSAKKSVQIVCDLPAYGLVSNNPAWLRIKAAIEEKISQGLNVAITTFDEEGCLAIIKEQAEYIASTKKGYFNKFGDVIKRELGVLEKDFTRDHYVRCSVDRHREISRECFRNADLAEASVAHPLYVWIVDGKEAIFVIPAYANDMTELGFRTSDGNIVGGLVALATRVRMKSETDRNQPPYGFKPSVGLHSKDSDLR